MYIIAVYFESYYTFIYTKKMSYVLICHMYINIIITRYSKCKTIFAIGYVDVSHLGWSVDC